MDRTAWALIEVMVGTLVQIDNMDHKHTMSATTSSTPQPPDRHTYGCLVLKTSHSQDVSNFSFLQNMGLGLELLCIYDDLVPKQG